MEAPAPEPFKGTLGLLWQLATAATPLTVLVMLLAGYLVWTNVQGQLAQERDRNERLVQLLLADKAAHLDLARRCARGNGVPERRE